MRNKLIINGNIYICPTKILKNKGSFESKTYIPLIINSKKQNIDIDNIDDFNTAKHMLNKLGLIQGRLLKEKLKVNYNHFLGHLGKKNFFNEKNRIEKS